MGECRPEPVMVPPRNMPGEYLVTSASENTIQSMRIEGTVTYQDLEGGFWGIETADGSRYRPVEGLPASVRREGCHVVAELEPAHVVSFTMWGQNVRIVKIKEAGD